MADLHIDGLNLEAAFVDFLADLFSAKNFLVLDREPRSGPDLKIDGFAAPVLVELKLHRSEQIARKSIRNALVQLAGYLRIENARDGILIVTQPIDLTRIEVPSGIVVWDLDELVRQTSGHPTLASRLRELLQALEIGAERRPVLPEPPSPLVAAAGAIENEAPLEADPAAGAALVARLSALKPGREDAAKFEQACEEALRLMFGTEFVGWQRQNEVDEGFQRMDLIARLVPTQNPFWSTLASDFRTRYVVFEFKNYTDPIGQDQIYTTERYLFTAALRSVAIIVARCGVGEGGRKAIRGSLREQGKLILCIDLEELCAMLHKRDGGGDPTDLLYERLDDLLTTIAR